MRLWLPLGLRRRVRFRLCLLLWLALQLRAR
jgi:hypothetical protein